MKNKIYLMDNLELIKSKKEEIKKKLTIILSSFLVLIVILGLLLIVKYPTVFLVVGIALSLVVTVYTVLTIIVKYKRLVSYEKLLNEIKRFELDKVEVKILNKTSGYRTINDLKFIEYRAVLTSDKRKERIILVEENIELPLQIDSIYNITLSNTFLVDIDELEVHPIVIDNSFNKERITHGIVYHWYIYLLVAALLVGGLTITEYYVNLPSDSEVLRVWVDKPGYFTSSMKEKLHLKAEEIGLRDSLIYEYYYDDKNNYNVAFTTVGLFETDIYLLVKDNDDEYEDAIETYQDDLFMDLSFIDIDGAEYYSYNGANIGIKYKDYYIFARNQNTKTQEQIKEVIEYILTLK